MLLVATPSQISHLLILTTAEGLYLLADRQRWRGRSFAHYRKVLTLLLWSSTIRAIVTLGDDSSVLLLRKVTVRTRLKSLLDAFDVLHDPVAGHFFSELLATL